MGPWDQVEGYEVLSEEEADVEFADLGGDIRFAARTAADRGEEFCLPLDLTAAVS